MVDGQEEVGLVRGDGLDGTSEDIAARFVLPSADPDDRVPEGFRCPRDLLGQEVAEVEKGNRQGILLELRVPEPVPKPEGYRSFEGLLDRTVIFGECGNFGSKGECGERRKTRFQMNPRDFRDRGVWG